MIVMGSWHSGCQRREANAGDIFKASGKKKTLFGMCDKNTHVNAIKVEM
jgi:hypothetical protein